MLSQCMPWVFMSTPHGAAKQMAENLAPRDERKGKGAQKKQTKHNLARGVPQVFVIRGGLFCFGGGGVHVARGVHRGYDGTTVSIQQYPQVQEQRFKHVFVVLYMVNEI